MKHNSDPYRFHYSAQELGTSAMKKTSREGGVFRSIRPHSSWNEKLTAGSRRRQTLPRSKSQASWTDVAQGDLISCKNPLMAPTV